MNRENRFRVLLEVLIVSTKLGLTSFGGPIAHLGYFHNEYIRRRKWLDERSYGDLVALSQFLPGPASSQVGIGVGIIRAGLWGGVVAWLGFTLPSLIALILFALLMQGFDMSSTGWIDGLKIVAVAIVAQAVLSMGQKLSSDRNRMTIAILATTITLVWPSIFSQLIVIIFAGVAGLLLYRRTPVIESHQISVPISRAFALICLIVFFALLFGLPLIRELVASDAIALFDSFYRSGSLVFGGGHVVLPLLERELVPTGWISEADFLAGYGAAQAVPGPLFTFAGYVGAMISGVKGAFIATTAIFLPAFLLMVGVMPFWNSMRQNAKAQGALMGINAAVVGILLSALYNPLWTTAILAPADFALAGILFVMLVFWKCPPWMVVVLGALVGMILA